MKKSQNIMTKIVCKTWDFMHVLFMSLLRAPIFKNSHFLAEMYFLKTRPRSNFKGFR